MQRFGREILLLRLALRKGLESGFFHEFRELVVGDFRFVDPEAGYFDLAERGFLGKVLGPVRRFERALEAMVAVPPEMRYIPSIFSGKSEGLAAEPLFSPQDTSRAVADRVAARRSFRITGKGYVC